MAKIPCKSCKYWKEWILAPGRTLRMPGGFGLKHAKKGDCHNDDSDKVTTYSSHTCSFAELKKEKK